MLNNSKHIHNTDPVDEKKHSVSLMSNCVHYIYNTTSANKQITNTYTITHTVTKQPHSRMYQVHR